LEFLRGVFKPRLLGILGQKKSTFSVSAMKRRSSVIIVGMFCEDLIEVQRIALVNRDWWFFCSLGRLFLIEMRVLKD
jgi:hypothetical protein